MTSSNPEGLLNNYLQILSTYEFGIAFPANEVLRDASKLQTSVSPTPWSAMRAGTCLIPLAFPNKLHIPVTWFYALDLAALWINYP